MEQNNINEMAIKGDPDPQQFRSGSEKSLEKEVEKIGSGDVKQKKWKFFELLRKFKDKILYKNIEKDSGQYAFTPGNVYKFKYQVKEKTFEQDRAQREKNADEFGGNILAALNIEGRKYLKDESKAEAMSSRTKIGTLINDPKLLDLWKLKAGRAGKDPEELEKFESLRGEMNLNKGSMDKWIKAEIATSLSDLGYGVSDRFSGDRGEYVSEKELKTFFMATYLQSDRAQVEELTDYVPTGEEEGETVIAMYAGERIYPTTGTIVPKWYKLTPRWIAQDVYGHYSDKLVKFKEE